MNLKTNPSTIHQPAKNPIGTYHLADNPNLYEIQRNNNFEFIVTGLDNLVRAGALGTERNAIITNAQEVLRLSVDSTFLPNFSINPIEVRRGNNAIKYAGVPTFGSGEITYNDYIGADTVGVLAAWHALAYDVNTEKVGLVDDYKKTCWIVEYSPDYQVVRKYVLYGVWVSDFQQDTMTSEGGKHKCRCTIQYDKAMIDVSDDI